MDGLKTSKFHRPGYLAENRAVECANVTIAFAILEVFFISIFFFARCKSKTANGWDTYLMVPAFLFCYSIIPVNILLILYGGVGRHLASLTITEIDYFMKLFVTMQFTYVPSVTLPKLAILALYQRIFTTRFYRWMSYSIGIFMILVWLASLILAFTECQPFEYSWNKWIPGHCIDLMILFRYISGLNLASDLAILILPLPIIWGLHTSRVQKIGLTLTFLTGSVGMITCILRFVVFYRTDILSDPTWFSIEMTIWTTTESGLYLIAACLPSLRSLMPLIVKHEYFGKFRTKLSGYHSKLFSRQRRSCADNNTEEPKGREWECDGEKKTSSGMKIGPRRQRFEKWARLQGPASSGDENAPERLRASCYQENSPRTLKTGNSDVDMERGDRGIPIQERDDVSMDTTTSSR